MIHDSNEKAKQQKRQLEGILRNTKEMHKKEYEKKEREHE